MAKMTIVDGGYKPTEHKEAIFFHSPHTSFFRYKMLGLHLEGYQPGTIMYHLHQRHQRLRYPSKNPSTPGSGRICQRTSPVLQNARCTMLVVLGAVHGCPKSCDLGFNWKNRIILEKFGISAAKGANKGT